MRGCKRSLIQTFLDEFVWRFNNDVTTDRILCYNLILETLAKFYQPGNDFKKIDELFYEANGDPEEEVTLHFIDDDESDDECDDVDSQDDVESLFGSLIGSNRDIASIDDLEDMEKDSDDKENIDSESDEETLSKNTTDSITIKEKEIDSDNQSISDVNDDVDVLGISLSELNFNTVKDKADGYRKLAMTEFETSEIAKLEAKKAISKHPNPIACPICGNMFKNEKGVKLHKAKKH